MSTKFQAGDLVTSTVDAQGLRKGITYRVTDVDSWSNVTGTYTSYKLEAVDRDAPNPAGWIGNGHLILRLVPKVEDVAPVAPVAPRFDRARVMSVYSGKDGMCCCGCSGKHYYASGMVDVAGKDRGYAVAPDEVSDRMVAKVARIVGAAAVVDVQPSYVSTVVGERLYTVYLAPEVKA